MTNSGKTITWLCYVLFLRVILTILNIPLTSYTVQMKIFGQMKRQPRCEDLVGKPINLKMSLFQKKWPEILLKQLFLDFLSQIQPPWKLWKWNRMFWKKLDLSIRLPSTNSISLYNSYKIPNFHQHILANFNPFPHARHDLFYRSIHILGKNSEKIGGHV